LIGSVSLPAKASEESAKDFLVSLQGDFSGRGDAILIGSKKERIACKINSAFDPEQSTLTLSGECASTKGKGEVNGNIKVVDDDVSGNFVSPRKNVRVTQSSGHFIDGKMVFVVSMMDDNVGKLIRVQQVIEKTDEGITADFFTFDNATQSYERTGQISFERQ
jgi:hypothetical protein